MPSSSLPRPFDASTGAIPWIPELALPTTKSPSPRAPILLAFVAILMRSLLPTIRLPQLLLTASIALIACDRTPDPVLTAASAASKVEAVKESVVAAPSNAKDKEEQPYADMGHTLGTVTSVPIRGRLVEEEGQPDLREATPTREMSQDELKETDFEAVLLGMDGKEIAKLGVGKSDGEGYIDAAFPLKEGTVNPGRYRVDIRVKGVSAGKTNVLLLANDFKGSVVRSDIDLTYLDTHFIHKRDMLKLLTQKAAERKTLPAMEKVYAALRAGVTGKENRPLVFISGSPRFFKRILEAKMQLDGVEQDGIMLKPFEEIAGNQVANLNPDRIVPALKEQVGYKLGHLLRGRLDLPKKAEEILMGDDSEADFVVYSIYHRLMSGELEGEAANKELLRGGVDPSQAGELIALASKVRATLGGFKPVKAIYINLTGSPNEKLKVKDWPVPGLLREHQGAWPLILDLYEESLVSKDSVSAVKARLIELGTAPKTLEEAAKAAVKAGFLDAKSASL